mgnify:CR=1 FL=1
MKNQEVARLFRDIADILQIKGANPFRIRAYQKAAQNIESLSEDIAQISEEGRLTSIPGIGKDLSEGIEEFLATGTTRAFEELKKSIPLGLLELLSIPSLGPKTAKLFYEQLGIKDLKGLQDALRKGKLTQLYGIKEKTVANIAKGIELIKMGKERMTLAKALEAARPFLAALEQLAGVEKFAYAGSLRRCRETVRDIDILVVSRDPAGVIGSFVKLEPVADILAKGTTKSAVRTREGIQVDCRVVEKKSFGAALLYFTGSKNFNIRLRQMAIKKGLKINEYGVFKGEKLVAGKSEEEIFRLLGMQYVEPELREDSGEIEAALGGSLPRLIAPSDIKGDLHAHSQWSDGQNSIEEMAEAAMRKGYSYLAITDHSQGLVVANGLNEQALKKKKRQIDKLNARIKKFRILFATEVDIRSDGSLDYPDRVLAQFDLVVAAIHSGFKQPRHQLTHRLLSACRSPYVHIIAHPTGRLFCVRDAYDADMEALFKEAAETNTALEVNAYPNRMDLNDAHCRRAGEMGVRLAIGTDAHDIEHLDGMSLGVSICRRGWLEKKNVLNALDTDTLLRTIKRKKV